MDILTFTSGAIGLVIGLTEAIKRAVALEERWAPLLAVIIGVGLAFLGSAAGLVLPKPVGALAAWYGIVAGLAAAGLYSGFKATMRG